MPDRLVGRCAQMLDAGCSSATPQAMEQALADILEDTVTRLVRASADKRAAWRLPVLATVSPSHGPQGRTVVLRGVQRDPLGVDVFTDARSPKVDEIAADPRVSLAFWDKGASLQLRLGGAAETMTEGDAVDEAKRRLSNYPGADYARVAVPGAPATNAEEAEARLADGLAHFALIRITAHRLDWLELARDGHRRAMFSRSGTAWQARWAVP